MHGRLSPVEVSTGASRVTDDAELRPLLEVDDVAGLLGLPVATLRHWHTLSTVDLPVGPRAFRMGRHLCYTLKDVRTYIEHLRQASS